MKLAIAIVVLFILSYLTFLYFNGDNLVIAGWHTVVYPPYFIVATVSLVLLWLFAFAYLVKKVIKTRR